MPDDQLSLAIGKEGQNARLAARLTGYKIDIKPESQADVCEEDEFAQALQEAQEAAEAEAPVSDPQAVDPEPGEKELEVPAEPDHEYIDEIIRRMAQKQAAAREKAEAARPAAAAVVPQPAAEPAAPQESLEPAAPAAVQPAPAEDAAPAEATESAEPVEEPAE